MAPLKQARDITDLALRSSITAPMDRSPGCPLDRSTTILLCWGKVASEPADIGDGVICYLRECGPFPPAPSGHQSSPATRSERGIVSCRRATRPGSSTGKSSAAGIATLWFVDDSLLEGDGFEPSRSPATVELCASGRARHDRRIGRLGARWGRAVAVLNGKPRSSGLRAPRPDRRLA
jgi:hypothetical protein